MRSTERFTVVTAPTLSEGLDQVFLGMPSTSSSATSALPDSQGLETSRAVHEHAPSAAYRRVRRSRTTMNLGGRRCREGLRGSSLKDAVIGPRVVCRDIPPAMIR